MLNRQLDPSKGEITDWLRHPVTEWFFTTLRDRIGGEPDIMWRGAATWEETCRLQGKAAVMRIIADVLGG